VNPRATSLSEKQKANALKRSVKKLKSLGYEVELRPLVSVAPIQQRLTVFEQVPANAESSGLIFLISGVGVEGTAILWQDLSITLRADLSAPAGRPKR